jgi:CRISPR-associated endoribonuclease Cas6
MRSATTFSPEIARVHLDLVAVHGATFTQSLSRTLHAAIHKLLHDHNPLIAEIAHHAPTKPVVIGPLRHRSDNTPLQQGCVSGTRVHCTIATLNRDVTNVLLVGLDHRLRRSEPLIVGPVAWLIDDWRLESPPHLPLLPRTYAELATTAAVGEVELEFTSPVVFRHGGEVRLEPDPKTVFGGYLRRWQVFSDVPLPVEMDRLDEHITLVSHRTQDAWMDIGVTAHPGFTGWARYRIGGDAAFAAGVSALAMYAGWCGTGARTAWGMGQTSSRLLPREVTGATVNGTHREADSIVAD